MKGEDASPVHREQNALARYDFSAPRLFVEGDLSHRLADLLTTDEVDALRRRAESLLSTRTHPVPSPGWPAIPWPAM